MCRARLRLERSACVQNRTCDSCCFAAGLPEVTGRALLWGLVATPGAHCAYSELLGVGLYSRDLAEQLEEILAADGPKVSRPLWSTRLQAEAGGYGSAAWALPFAL